VQAFKQHALHDPLKEPGSADLTADVDFAYLQRCISGGLIFMSLFLLGMGKFLLLFLYFNVGFKLSVSINQPHVKRRLMSYIHSYIQRADNLTKVRKRKFYQHSLEHISHLFKQLIIFTYILISTHLL
jgi:hypothetical protein